MSDVDQYEAFLISNGMPAKRAKDEAWLFARRQEIAATLPDSIPPMTAFTIAGDKAGAEMWKRIADDEGKPYEEVANLVGSYARLDFALDHCAREWVYERLPDLWRGSDPDDTDVRFLTLWRDAVEWNGGTLVDQKPLPKARILTVYRGQMMSDPLGIAWTLDGATAHKFARGAGLRTGDLNGVVLRGRVKRTDVLGYLTGRGESEIVVNSTLVRSITVLGGYGEYLDTPAPPNGAPRAS